MKILEQFECEKQRLFNLIDELRAKGVGENVAAQIACSMVLDSKEEKLGINAQMDKIRGEKRVKKELEKSKYPKEDDPIYIEGYNKAIEDVTLGQCDD